MTHDEIAQKFVAARKSATFLDGYPGEVPSHLSDSYAIQDRAIKLWNQPVIGWKIGRLHPDKQGEHKTERLAGPIFAPLFKPYAGETLTLPVFEGGFAAVEAEYVFRIAHDTDPQKTSYTEEEALRLIDAVFAGIEMAGSPLATINKLGPTVVASDFGNNFGLILGEQLAEFDSDSTEKALDAEAVKGFTAKTEIDGAVVGEGGLFTMPNGPLAAIAWIAGHVASRGLPLTKGQLISSGATTGIHDIAAGQASVVTFSGPGAHSSQIRLNAVKLGTQHTEIG